MPCDHIFTARFAKHTLPVRSPLPNKHPSTRSAPASIPSSAHAVPVPRSLCGCKLIITLSRFGMFLWKYSTWSAYTLGVETSMVAGRLKINLLLGLAPQRSITAVQISTAKSASVMLKVSGEYSNTHLVCGYWAMAALMSSIAFKAKSMVCWRFF